MCWFRALRGKFGAYGLPDAVQVLKDVQEEGRRAILLSHRALQEAAVHPLQLLLSPRGLGLGRDQEAKPHTTIWDLCKVWAPITY